MTHHHLSFCVAERERINNLNSIPCYFTICVYIFRVREGIVNKWIDNISISLQIFYILSFFLTTRFSGKPKKEGKFMRLAAVGTSPPRTTTTTTTNTAPILTTSTTIASTTTCLTSFVPPTPGYTSSMSLEMLSIK